MADYSSIIDAAGKKWNVDPALLNSVVGVESSGNAGAFNPAGGGQGATGLMQVRGPALQDYNKANGTNYQTADLKDPAKAVDVGAWYLSKQLDRFGNPQQALVAYSQGPNSAQAAQGGASQYSQKVLGGQGQQMPQSTLPGIPQFSQSAPSAQSSAFDALPVTGAAAPAAPTQAQSAFDALPVQAAPMKVSDNSQAPNAQASNRPNAVSPKSPLAGSAFAKNLEDDADFNEGAAKGALNLFKGAGQLALHGVNSLAQSVAPNSGVANTLQGWTGQYDNYLNGQAQQDQGRSGMFGAGKMFGNIVPIAMAGGPAPSTATNALIRTAANVGKGSAFGGATAALNPVETNGDDFWQQKGQQSGTGALLGGAAPLATGVAGMVKNALIGSASPEVQALAQKAQDLGINPTIPQMTDNKFTKMFSSAADNLPLSGAGPRIGAQNEQFSRAISNTFGEDTPNLTQGVLQQAKSRIGQVYDTVLGRNNLQADPTFVNDLSTIQQNANANLPQAEADTVNKWVNGIINKVGPNGDIPGKAYQSFRSDVLMRAEGNNSQPFLSGAATQLRNAIDDAFSRSLAGTPDADAFAQARQQYGNLMTVSKLADKSPTGEISPKQVLQAVNNSGRKTGDLADLGRVGKQFLGSQTPDSGTASRTLINTALLGGSGAGAIAAGITPQVATGFVAGNLGNRLLNSQWAANAFLNGAPNVSNALRVGQVAAPQIGNQLLQGNAQRNK